MNLVQVSALTKRILAILVMLVSLYVFILIIKRPIVTTWLVIFPPKNLPTVAFGLLPPLEFTRTQTLTSAPQYVLNTKTGALPENLPTQMKIYQYIQPEFSYSAGEKAQKDALILGFTDDMITSALSDPVSVWQDVSFGGRLVIDSKTGIMETATPMGGKGTLYPAGKLTRTLALETAKDILNTLERSDDILYTSQVDGFQDVVFGKFGSGGLIKADSTLEAQVAKVNFFRNVEGVPILGPDPSQAMIQVVLREPGSKDLFPQLSFPMMKVYNWKVDPNSSATYPLIPVSTAWDEVSQNGGIISGVVPGGSNPFTDNPTVRVDQILINEIYLAYFDNSLPQQFLQPVYVFEGNYTAQSGGSGSIFIYYPAVSGEYVYQPQTSQP